MYICTLLKKNFMLGINSLNNFKIAYSFIDTPNKTLACQNKPYEPAFKANTDQFISSAGTIGETNYVGKTTIIEKATGKPVDALITCKVREDKVEGYKIYVGEEQIGYIDLKVLTPEQMIKDKYQPGRDYALNGCICIDIMMAQRNDKYRDIGTKLHQIAVERSLEQGYEGRVLIEACFSSHGFHYKSGFRPLSRECNEDGMDCAAQIETVLSNAKQQGIKPDTSHLGCIVMGLPEEKIPAWKQRIEETPIIENKNNIK